MKGITAIGIAAVLLPGLALAGPNQSYGEISYSTGDMDFGVSGLGSADIDQDGIKLEASTVAGENVLLRGSYAVISGDENGFNLDTDTFVGGAGWLLPLNDSTNVDIGLEYRTDDLEVDAGSGDVNGVGIALGIASSLTDSIDVAARATYLGSDYEGSISYDLSGTYFFSDTVGISLGYENLEVDEDGVSIELSQALLGVRMKF